MVEEESKKMILTSATTTKTMMTRNKKYQGSFNEHTFGNFVIAFIIIILAVSSLAIVLADHGKQKLKAGACGVILIKRRTTAAAPESTASFARKPEEKRKRTDGNVQQGQAGVHPVDV